MKRRDLIARIIAEGCVLVRTIGKHDFYRNVITGDCQSVPRHREIKEFTATMTSTATLLVFAQHYVQSTGATVRNIAEGAYLYGFSITTNSMPACNYLPCTLDGRALEGNGQRQLERCRR